jgi:6-phosphogluconolactonase (cycloisomerase 2 family)
VGSTTKWSRRTFLSTSGLISASTLIPLSLRAQLNISSEPTAPSFLACAVSHHARHAFPWKLHAFAVQNGSFRSVASMVCADAIGAVAIHPLSKLIYVAHDTESYLDLPRATVSCFAIDESKSEFKQLGRQPLSLSATRPRHMTISPNGKTLLIAATGGGAYNVLSIAPDGRILPHPRSIKLTGCGPHPLQTSAQPVFSCFGLSGHVAYACDFGSDRVDQLLVTDDVASIQSSATLSAGTGPRHLAIHPSRQRLAIVGSLRPILTMIETDTQSGKISRVTQQLDLRIATLECASFDSSGYHLFVMGRTKAAELTLLTFHVNPASLRVRQTSDELISGVEDPRTWQGRHGLASSQAEDFRLVATNVPAPYSPIITSPENVLSTHLPVKV